MATCVAELARAVLSPDRMSGAVSRCVPVQWRQTKHGRRAQSQVCRVERIRSRGRTRIIEVRWCPVAYDPHPELIAAAHQAYDEWRAALEHVRDALLAGGILRGLVVEERLPLARPWARGGEKEHWVFE